jgi:hypothetical protein
LNWRMLVNPEARTWHRSFPQAGASLDFHATPLNAGFFQKAS